MNRLPWFILPSTYSTRRLIAPRINPISDKRVAMRAVLEEERCKHQARLAEAEEHKSSL